MIADNELKKWEYKVQNLNVYKSPTGGETERAEKLAELLNTNGQGGWELVSTISGDALPEGFGMMKRPFQAPKVKSEFRLIPKVAKVAAPVVAKAVVPPAAKPVVAVAAAALSPTAGKTDAKAATA